MPEYSIPRSGRGPLTFRGELLVDRDGRPYGSSKHRKRWHGVSLYRTEAGAIVAVVRYRTEWPDDAPRDYCAVYDRPIEAVDALRHLPVEDDSLGFPPGAQFDSRRERHRLGCRRAWEALLAEVLAERPEVFGERAR